MFEFCLYTTNDGSVGLFSPSDDDIYHSFYGAVTEAFEKFIMPACIPEFIFNNDGIRVLDICYGIGYNTKTFLNFILNLKSKNFLKNYLEYKNKLSVYDEKIYTDNLIADKYNEPLYSDKISKNNIQSNCNEQIYTNNIFGKFSTDFLHDTIRKKLNLKNFSIKISSVEIEKDLVLISPFIKDKLSKSKNEKIENEKIKKILNFNQNPENASMTDFNEDIINLYSNLIYESIMLKPAVSTFLLDNILHINDKISDYKDIIHILNDIRYSGYFSPDIRRYFIDYINQTLNNTPKTNLNAFLHNIYYNHISNSHKMALNTLKSLNIDFRINIDDARQVLQSDDNVYDFVFLDAFTPAKVPCLWTYDFLKLIYNHLSDNGLLITYSSAAPVRNALINIGYFVGENFNPLKNKSLGTIASKNKSLIKYPLSEFNLGLLNSKAGINYRDENLNALNDEILTRRNLDVKNSNLMSTSKYKKLHKLP